MASISVAMLSALGDAVRPRVMADFPRGAFDRRFLDAIMREVAKGSSCPSDRLLTTKGLAGWMEPSPWSGRCGDRYRDVNRVGVGDEAPA